MTMLIILRMIMVVVIVEDDESDDDDSDNYNDISDFWNDGELDVEVNLLFNSTINVISVIYVTAHRCTGGPKKKFDLRSGSQRHRHFVRFFNVPFQAPTWGQPFSTVIPRNRPI